MSTYRIANLPSMILPRCEAATELLNDMIYTFGGYVEGNIKSNTVERYEILFLRGTMSSEHQ